MPGGHDSPSSLRVSTARVEAFGRALVLDATAMRVLPVARGQGAGSTLQNEIGEADWRKPRHLALAPPALVPPREATPAQGVTSR